MEDLLRSLAYWKLPTACSSVLEQIPLVGGAATKFTLGTLATHRGKTVDELIEESTNASLERSNYNNANEVSNLIQSLGLNTAPLSQFMPTLTIAMQRRHQIVHRADAISHPQPGRGNHRVASISPKKLEAWILNTERFAAAVFAQV